MLLCLFTGALQIVFPAGILRPPFFNKDWPGYLKYGAFGQVASHELTVCLNLHFGRQHTHFVQYH